MAVASFDKDEYMKKYYILFAAVLLLILDIRIPAVAYPAFEAFETEAPKTVDLVIHHVIGEKVRIDILSDTLGYLLLAAASVLLSVNNKKFRKVLLWTAFGLGMHLYRNCMPFFLNGHERFRMGDLIYFVAAVLEEVVVFYAMYALCSQLETLENHSYNNVTMIVAMICIGTGIVTAIMYFYDLMILAGIYYGVQIILTGVYWYMINKDKKMLIKWEEEHA